MVDVPISILSVDTTSDGSEQVPAVQGVITIRIGADILAPVHSVAGRKGAVVLTAADVGVAAGATANRTDDATDALLAAKAPLAGPAFTGTPTAPTAALGTSTNQLATMAALKAALDALVAGAPGALDTLNEIALRFADDESAATALTAAVGQKLDASLVSTFALGLLDDTTDSAMRTTLGLGTASTQAAGAFATPADVMGAKDRANHTGNMSADFVVDGTTSHAFTAADDTKLAGIATGATANRTDAATDALLAAKSPLASPTFTGTPAAPTPTTGDSSTKLATTAFVGTAIAAIPASGASAGADTIDVTSTPYNAVGNGTGDQTAALNSALAAAVKTGKILIIPPGDFRVADTVNGGGGNNGQIRLRGVPGRSRIQSTSATADVMHLGNGSLTGSLVNGFVEGIVLAGTRGAPPQNGRTALKLDALTQLALRQVTATDTDIGFDHINNTYGLSYYDCRAGFFGACNVGVNLRSEPTAGAGNQGFFWNCWLEGLHAGVHISPNSDGYSFFGGQVVAGRGVSALVDGNGAFILSKDYTSGATGSIGNIGLYAVDFEQVGVWIFRAYGELFMTVNDCPFLSNGTVNTIGIMKLTNGGNPSVVWQNCSAVGAFRNAIPLDLGDYGAGHFREEGWRIPGDGRCTFGGVAPTTNSLLALSGKAQGISLMQERDGTTQIRLGGRRLKFVGSALHAGDDAGSFSAVGSAGATPVAPNKVSSLSRWYAADRQIGVADAAAVATFTDSSTAAANATQDTAANQPTYRSARSAILLPPAGQPVMQFDGTADFLSTTLSASAAMSGLVVAMASDANTLLGSNTGGGLRFRVGDNMAKLYIESDNTAPIGLGAVINLRANEYHVFGFSYANPGAWILTYDGAVVASGTSTQTLATGKALNIGKGSGGSYWKGGIAEVALYSTAKSAADLLSVASGLMRKYGIV